HLGAARRRACPAPRRGGGRVEAPPVSDRLITPQEAAARVGVAARTLIKRRHRLPYSAWLVPSGTRLIRFSDQRITEYLASKTMLVPVPGQRARVRSTLVRP